MTVTLATRPADGTDAGALPVVDQEKRWLGLTATAWQRLLAPVAIGAVVLGLWEFAVWWFSVPYYILPGPWRIFTALIADWGTLSASLWITLEITGLALLLAVVVGGALAILFTQSKWLEFSLFPYAIILQVTPIVAIAPLIIIWVNDTLLSLLICAWIVAFFPILSNTILGLNSADHNLLSLFQLYGASRWQTLRYLRLPAALPYFLGGLRISGGLSLIGAVVAEFVAGTGGTASGLAFRILEASYQLKIPRMFAALALVSLSGIVIFLVLSLVSHCCCGAGTKALRGGRPRMKRTGFTNVADQAHYWISDARAQACVVEGEGLGQPDFEGMVRLDLEIRDGRVVRLAPLGAAPAGAVDLRGGQVWPGFVDVHTHLDKGHIWPRSPNPDGSFLGAASATMSDRGARWHAEDVRARMEFGLRCAWAQGTVAVRTHLDSVAPQADISWPVFREVRDAWAGRIELQASSIMPLDLFAEPYGEHVADLVAEAGGMLGAVTRLSGEGHEALPPEFLGLLELFFRLAMDRGLDMDLHVDESGDHGARALIEIARMAQRVGYKGRLQCGHCCSLAVQSDSFVEATLKAVADAGITVVSLPMCNMYLQGRTAGRTPRWRGVTLLHEMKAAGVPVSIASDNCRDPFYAYGDHDMIEVMTQATRIAQLDHPFGDWPRAFTSVPASVMGLDDLGRLKAGAPADLVLLSARFMSEMLSRGQADRVVLRGGKPIDTSLPDYRELDPRVGSGP
jgi:cytosine deaminase